MVGDEEDDRGLAVHCTKGEIDRVPGRKWCNVTQMVRQELTGDIIFALQSMTEHAPELRMTRRAFRANQGKREATDGQNRDSETRGGSRRARLEF